MSFTMEDSLESGWVSVRPNVFDEKEKHKFIFIVAWNDVEGKFAITCHDRTVQKRTALRDSLADAAEEGEPSAGGAEQAVLRSSLRSPVRPVRSPVKEKAEAARGRSVASDRSRPVRSPSKAAAAGVGAGDAGDTEVVEPVRSGSPAPEDAEDPDAGPREDFSWAGLFSFQDVRAAHLQLCAVNSDLELCLPAFPEEPSAVWSVLFGAPQLTQRETEALCYQLQVYLGHALDTCGWKILSQVLFADSDDSEEYYESLSELRQKGYEDALQRTKKRLQEVRRSRYQWGALI